MLQANGGKQTQTESHLVEYRKENAKLSVQSLQEVKTLNKNRQNTKQKQTITKTTKQYKLTNDMIL